MCKRVGVPVCSEESESVFHIVVSCHFAKQCCSASKFDYARGADVDFSSWLQSNFLDVLYLNLIRLL